QSYFESRLARLRGEDRTGHNETDTSDGGDTDTTTRVSRLYSDQAIIKMAIRQCSVKHMDGVVGVGRGFRTVNGAREMCMQINASDEKYVEDLSKPLDV